MEEFKRPTLSICIPTYNRSKYLDQSLSVLSEQIKYVDEEDVEIFISDNCSDDETSQVVLRYIAQSSNIRYNCNVENIGASRNFLKCIEEARGKYIWLLGDDDFLVHNSLAYILDILKKGDFGLIHLIGKSDSDGFQITKNTNLFFNEVSYNLTFVSANIFNRSALKRNEDPEKYIFTRLIQLPFYLYGILEHDQNVLIYKKTLQSGSDSSNNGGYNFFEVFAKSYLGIWDEFRRKRMLTFYLYEREKYLIFRHFLFRYIDKLLIRKDLGRFKVDNAWGILLKLYGMYPYFYIAIMYLYLKKYINAVK